MCVEWNYIVCSDDVMWKNECALRGYTTRSRDGESCKDVFVTTREYIRALKTGSALKVISFECTEQAQAFGHGEGTIAACES